MENISFGGIEVDKDVRDYRLENVGAGIPIPLEFRPDYSMIPVLHQHQIPACGAHAGTALKMIQEYYDSTPNPSYSARYLWNKIKKIDNFPLEAGTDIYSIFKTLKNFGVCNLSLVDNNTLLPLVEYSTLTPDMNIDTDASWKEIESYATTYSPTFDQLKQAIYINKAVLILMRVGQNMYRPTWNEMPLNPDRYPLDGGHFVCAIGYDEKYIYWRNSWGETFGTKGDGYFAENYMKYVVCIGTAIDKKNVTPDVLPKQIQDVVDKSPSPTWTANFLGYLRKFGVLK